MTNPEKGYHPPFGGANRLPYPGRLASLWDMLYTNPIEYITLGLVIGLLESILDVRTDISKNIPTNALLGLYQNPPIPQKEEREAREKKHLLDGLTLVEWPCKRLDLKVSLALIEKMRNDPPQSNREIKLLLEAITSEARQRLLLLVSPDRLKFHNNNEKPLSPEVTAKFPKDLIDHVKDASTCYALEQHKACIYHLVGALDLAFKGIAKSLDANIDINDPTLTWNDIEERIKEGIKNKKAKSRSWKAKSWKAKEPLYEEIILDLRVIKKVIRNPSSHFRKAFSDKDALKLLNDVPMFLEHYAKTLKTRNPASAS